MSEAEVYERLARAGRAQRRRRGAGLLRRRRDVRPLRAGDRRRDHPALRVPHPLHALPAGDLPGRAAGDVRVPDGDVGADRAAGLQRRPLRGALLGRLGRLPGDGARPGAGASSSPAGSTRTAARRSRPTRRATAPRWSRSASTAGSPTPPRWPTAVDEETAAVFLQSPNFLGAVEDVEALGERGPGARRAAGRRRRPDDPRHPAAARRVRRRHRPRRGPAARQPARLRRPLVRLLLRHRGAHPPHAGADRRRDRGRRRAPRLRPRPADPRAAHPPREGDPQHLHRAGAERARRDGPPRLARARGLPRAGRAAGPAHRLRARAAGRGRRASSCCTRRRWCASSRSASTRRSSAVLERCAERGIAAGYPLGREYPEHEDGLLVAITERRTREQIDELAEALGRRGARPRARATAEVRRAMSLDRDADAARRARDDLREVEAGPARRGAARRRRARAAARGADPGRSCCAPSRRGCRRSPSRRSSATTTGSRAATSTSTPASTRSARAR